MPNINPDIVSNGFLCLVSRTYIRGGKKPDKHKYMYLSGIKPVLTMLIEVNTIKPDPINIILSCVFFTKWGDNLMYSFNPIMANTRTKSVKYKGPSNIDPITKMINTVPEMNLSKKFFKIYRVLLVNTLIKKQSV
jgi:hypothetical protein